MGALTRIARQSGVTRPIWLMPILESALGIENAYAVATASDRVVALTIGLEDYTADLGVAKTPAEWNRYMRACGWSTRPTLRACRRSTRCTVTPAIATGSCAGASVARHGLRRHGLHSSRPDRHHSSCLCSHSVRVGKSAEYCRCLRRRTGAWLGRGQPWLQDGRRSRGAAGPEAGGAGRTDGM